MRSLLCPVWVQTPLLARSADEGLRATEDHEDAAGGERLMIFSLFFAVFLSCVTCGLGRRSLLACC